MLRSKIKHKSKKYIVPNAGTANGGTGDDGVIDDVPIDCSVVSFCPVDNLADGEFGVSVVNGTAPYVTNWELASLVDDITIISLIVTDANGCSCRLWLVQMRAGSSAESAGWFESTGYNTAQDCLNYVMSTDISDLPNYNALGDLGLVVSDDGLIAEDYAISSGCNCD